MTTNGLLFIPDISGFTAFVTATEIDHSRLIIQELLEVVIASNQIGLQVSEVEGDAVLFFRFGDCPDMGALSAQVERTFRDFHRRLGAYEINRFCQCRACVSAGSLTLKVITHYGEFTSYTVSRFEKLIGKDVIVAHQLLKNHLDQREYWLVTSGLPSDGPTADLPPWIEWSPGTQRTEAGDILFRYTPLTPLRRQVAVEPLDLGLEVGSRTKMLSASREYPAHIITTFHATGDFRYRPRWQEGVERIEEIGHYLPRIGTRCRRIMEDGEEIVYASSYSFRPDRIEFSETDEAKSTSWYFTLERVEEYRTRVTVDVYVRRGVLPELWYRLTRKQRAEASLQRSLANLDALVPEIDVAVEY